MSFGVKGLNSGRNTQVFECKVVTWSEPLREVHWPRVIENGAVRKVFELDI
jgi:hypothetical protein